MADLTKVRKDPPSQGRRKLMLLTAMAALVLAAAWKPGQAIETAHFVISSLLSVAPLVVPGLLLSAWVNASGAGAGIAKAFTSNPTVAIVTASGVGAVTPVCGVTVLPLMAGLLASRVPLAPVMAFWLSSPVTDPAMFAVTGATLGLDFAIGKTLAAFGIGLLGGLATNLARNHAWTDKPLREGGLVNLLVGQGSCGGQPRRFLFAVWSNSERWRLFGKELWAMTRLVTLCLAVAFAAEDLMHELLEPQALAAYIGNEAWWAVPVAVFVGAPAYLDGYAALPLTRGLMDHGMSPAAAMAFLVSGSVVSIWGAIAIFPVLKAKPFALYLALAVAGSLLSGWLYGFVV